MARTRPRLLAIGALMGVVLVTSCTQPTPTDARPSLSSTPRPTPRPAPTETTPPPGTVAPPWLGTRVLPTVASGDGEVRRTPRALRHRRFTLPDTVAPLPGHGFASRVTTPAPDAVIARSTWRPGCPVGTAELSWVRVAFHGFDGARHTGELLVNTVAAEDVVAVFADLWHADFPIEQMVIATRADLDAPPTGDGNGTGAFVCRPVTGGTSYSQHAYGLAVDVDSFQNPYLRGTGADRVVLPELSSSYLDRGDVRPGMITADGPVVRAFSRIGWGWGGSYSSLKDYQHFSANGR